MRKIVFLALPLVFVAASLAQNARRTSQKESASAHLPPAAIGALQKIDPEHIRANVRFLSHDLLEGRGTGQRGGDIAAEYIATQFWLDGLKPAGDNGTFFQNVPMIRRAFDETSTIAVDGKTLHGGTDFIAIDGCASALQNWATGEPMASGECAVLEADGLHVADCTSQQDVYCETAPGPTSCTTNRASGYSGSLLSPAFLTASDNSFAPSKPFG